MTTFPAQVTVVEVGPRDGLQNEPANVPTAAKIALVDALARAGLPVVEVTAFVSPRWVPQMADAAEVLRGITRYPGTRYTALVPNEQGLARAIDAGVSEVAIFAAASETFSRRNINAGIDAALRAYAAVGRAAGAAGVRVRGYLSVCFGCPFEGDVPVERVATLAGRLLEECEVFEVAVSDTIGVAHPGSVRRVLDAVLERVPVERLGLHFHDTRGTALANVLSALSYGIANFDASAGGLGGCPFAPGARGNLATEDLLYMLDGLGIHTGASIDAVTAASIALEPAVGHAAPSRYVQAVRGHRAIT
jgi:isopropylmalate/homocitrate/citramalate synthase